VALVGEEVRNSPPLAKSAERAAIRKVALQSDRSTSSRPVQFGQHEDYSDLNLSVMALVSIAIAICAGIVAWHFLSKEARMVACRQIARDGRERNRRLFTDGKFIYFNETVAGKTAIASLPVNGASTSYLPIAPATLESLSIRRLG
jgi:hypothetical protein